MPAGMGRSGQLSGEEHPMDSKVDGDIETAARSKADVLRASFMETMSNISRPVPAEVPDEVYTSFHFANVQSIFGDCQTH